MIIAILVLVVFLMLSIFVVRHQSQVIDNAAERMERLQINGIAEDMRNRDTYSIEREARETKRWMELNGYNQVD